MSRLLTRNGKVIAAIAIFGVALVVYIWARLYRHLEDDRRDIIAAAVQRNSNLAVALEQYAIRTIDNADALLQVVQKEYETTGNDIDLGELVDKHTVEKDFFAQVSIVDEKGYVVAADFSIQMDTLVNVKDREHFRYHILNKNGGLFIGRPLLSRTVEKAAIPLSRRLSGADGSFKGTVNVYIEPYTFTRFYAEANLRPNDIISLIAPDGITYSRRTGSIDSYGENISKSPLFVHLKNKPVDNYFAKDAIRNIPTFFSYRKMKQYPVIATVGTSEQDILADHYERAKRDYVLSSLISALILLFCVLVCITLVLHRRNLDKVKESEVKYRSVFENSLDVIMLTDPDGKLVAANKAGGTFFKLSPDELCNRNVSDLVNPKDPAFKRLLMLEKRSGTAQGELQFVRDDGSKVTGEVASTRYKGADGNERCIIIIRDSTQRKLLQKKLADEQKRYQRKVTEQVIQAQEREREVIGRELHDNVNQVLTTVKLYLEMAIAHKETREELLPKSILHITESINEIRNLSRDLSAPTLGTKSLLDSLTALLEMVQSSSGLFVRLEYDTYDSNLSMDQKLAIYRIVQEQLNNVVKHAKATEVIVDLSQTENETVLLISDNGVGFDPSVKRNGIGINNIISRAKVFDGEVSIKSSPGKGCTILIKWPIGLATNDEDKLPFEEIIK